MNQDHFCYQLHHILRPLPVMQNMFVQWSQGLQVGTVVIQRVNQ